MITYRELYEVINAHLKSNRIVESSEFRDILWACKALCNLNMNEFHEFLGVSRGTMKRWCEKGLSPTRVRKPKLREIEVKLREIRSRWI